MFDDFFDLFDFNDDANDNLATDNLITDDIREVDLNGDGIPDTYVQSVDLDGDGIADADQYTSFWDTDGDGEIDSFIESFDFDGDGLYDAGLVTNFLDTDGDGVFDSIRQSLDSDENGLIDEQQTHTVVDANGDGVLDTIVTETRIDTDGDGLFDEILQDIDSELSDDELNYIFNGENYNNNPPFDAEDIDNDFPLDDIDNSGNAPAYENFDPDNVVNPESIIGNPEEDMQVWDFQGATNRCAVYSQKFVMEQLTGQEVDIEDFCDIAEANGWFTEEGGTPWNDVGNILEYMGLNVESSPGKTFEDIENCLENGGKVIVGVDADEIWSGESDDLFGPGMDADHALQVIGIDYSNPDEPMVILNDSGAANGCGAMVTLDEFMEAWEDSNFLMVEAYE